MNKRENAKILLKAMSDVDDAYVSEAQNAPVVEKKEKKAGMFSFMNTMRFATAALVCAAVAFVAVNVMHVNDVTDHGNNVQVVNPVEEVETIEEAESITGFTLEYAKDAEYDDELITVYDGNMIDVSFMNDEDTGYYIRKAAGSADISGDYNTYDVEESEDISGMEVNLKGDGEMWSLATWENDGYTYAIGCQSHPLTLEQISGLIRTIE